MPVAAPPEEKTLGKELLEQYRAMGDNPLKAWDSFDQLSAALAAEHPGAPPNILRQNTLNRQADGTWSREVPHHIGPDGFVEQDGARMQVVRWTPRRVELSREACQQLWRDHGIEADFWGGWTWWRRGIKPEKDIYVYLQLAEAEAQTELEPASEHDVAQFQSHEKRIEAVKPVMRRRE